MVVRTAARGRYEGQQFWGCSTFPRCRARIGIKTEDGSDGSAFVVAADRLLVSRPGASAQQEYERRKRLNRERIRRQWPFAVGVTLVVTFVIYLLVQAWLNATWGALAAAVVALGLLAAFVESPRMQAWQTGAEGERRTARYLDGLAEAGFVVLHDRRVPGYGGNLDHVAIGPTGVWAIETKNVAGKVEIDGDALKIRGYRQDRMVDQVYREAAAVQVALGRALMAVGVSVTPVICVHRAELPFFNKTVRGVRLASGPQLVRLLRSGDAVLSAEQVQELAAEADRLLTPAAR